MVLDIMKEVDAFMKDNTKVIDEEIERRLKSSISTDLYYIEREVRGTRKYYSDIIIKKNKNIAEAQKKNKKLLKKFLENCSK